MSDFYNYMIDFKTTNFDELESPFTLEDKLTLISAKLNLSKVLFNYKKFDPVGMTAFLLLSESHISIHTWPEQDRVCIDIFTCKSDIPIQVIEDLIRGQFGNLFELEIQEHKRIFKD